MGALCACALAAAAAVPGGERVRTRPPDPGSRGRLGRQGPASPGPWRPDGVRGVGGECEYPGPGRAEAYGSPRVRWSVPYGGLELREAAESLLLRAAAQNSRVVPAPGASAGLRAGGVSGFGVQILVGALQCCSPPQQKTWLATDP